MKKLYIIAALFALVTAIVVYQFAMYLEEISVAEAVPQSDVVVAAVPIAQYTVITAEMLAVKTVPTVSVMGDAVFDSKKLVGRVATVQFVADEQILLSQTAAEGDTDLKRLSVELKSGMTAYTLNVSVTTGVAGYIKKGDRVSLASVHDTTSADGKVSSEIEIFMRGIEVLRVSTSANENSLDYTSLTLEVTDEEALLLTYYDSIGTIKAFLTSFFTEDDGQRIVKAEKDDESAFASEPEELTVGGIFYSENAESQVVIATPSATLVLGAGDEITGTGWKVGEITRSHVTIERNGRSETLYPQPLSAG